MYGLHTFPKDYTAKPVQADRRDWIGAGCARIEVYGIDRNNFAAEAATLKWSANEGQTFPAVPALGIRKVCEECNVPRPTFIAWDGCLSGPDYGLGVYGIQANYKNGTVRLHVLDEGSQLAVVFCDVYPLGWVDAGRVTRDYPIRVTA